MIRTGSVIGLLTLMASELSVHGREGVLHWKVISKYLTAYETSEHFQIVQGNVRTKYNEFSSISFSRGREEINNHELVATSVYPIQDRIGT